MRICMMGGWVAFSPFCELRIWFSVLDSSLCWKHWELKQTDNKTCRVLWCIFETSNRQEQMKEWGSQPHKKTHYYTLLHPWELLKAFLFLSSCSVEIKNVTFMYVYVHPFFSFNAHVFPNFPWSSDENRETFCVLLFTIALFTCSDVISCSHRLFLFSCL